MRIHWTTRPRAALIACVTGGVVFVACSSEVGPAATAPPSPGTSVTQAATETPANPTGPPPSVAPSTAAASLPVSTLPAKTGVGVVDRFLTAFYQGDIPALVAQSDLTPVPCVTSGIGRRCQVGESPGSVRHMFFYGGGCGPGWVSPEGLSAMWASFPRNVAFWGIVRRADGYQVVFLREPQPGGFPVIVGLSQEGATGIGNTCAQPAEVAFPPGTDFLVPPK